MKKIKQIAIVLLSTFIITAIVAFNTTDKTEYKCIIQLANYTGEGAYVVVSLIDPEGGYDETLYMLGEDEKWYDYFKEWWGFWEKDKIDIDAITGESIIGGDRKVVKFKLDPSKMDLGYKIRFETAVEDQDYYMKDVEIDLTPTALKTKIKGSGYIRYIRFLPNK